MQQERRYMPLSLLPPPVHIKSLVTIKESVVPLSKRRNLQVLLEAASKPRKELLKEAAFRKTALGAQPTFEEAISHHDWLQQNIFWTVLPAQKYRDTLLTRADWYDDLRNDERYISLWIDAAKSGSAEQVFALMCRFDIGIGTPTFYLECSSFLEKCERWIGADWVLREGKWRVRRDGLKEVVERATEGFKKRWREAILVDGYREDPRDEVINGLQDLWGQESPRSEGFGMGLAWMGNRNSRSGRFTPTDAPASGDLGIYRDPTPPPPVDQENPVNQENQENILVPLNRRQPLQSLNANTTARRPRLPSSSGVTDARSRPISSRITSALSHPSSDQENRNLVAVVPLRAMTNGPRIDVGPMPARALDEGPGFTVWQDSDSEDDDEHKDEESGAPSSPTTVTTTAVTNPAEQEEESTPTAAAADQITATPSLLSFRRGDDTLCLSTCSRVLPAPQNTTTTTTTTATTATPVAGASESRLSLGIEGSTIPIELDETLASASLVEGVKDVTHPLEHTRQRVQHRKKPLQDSAISGVSLVVGSLRSPLTAMEAHHQVLTPVPGASTSGFSSTISVGTHRASTTSPSAAPLADSAHSEAVSFGAGHLPTTKGVSTTGSSSQDHVEGEELQEQNTHNDNCWVRASPSSSTGLNPESRPLARQAGFPSHPFQPSTSQQRPHKRRRDESDESGPEDLFADPRPSQRRRI